MMPANLFADSDSGMTSDASVDQDCDSDLSVDNGLDGDSRAIAVTTSFQVLLCTVPTTYRIIVSELSIVNLDLCRNMYE